MAVTEAGRGKRSTATVGAALAPPGDGCGKWPTGAVADGRGKRPTVALVDGHLGRRPPWPMGAGNGRRVREMVNSHCRGALRAPLDLGWRALGERPYEGMPPECPYEGMPLECPYEGMPPECPYEAGLLLQPN